jgi:hypothetical protein
VVQKLSHRRYEPTFEQFLDQFDRAIEETPPHVDIKLLP